MKRIIVLTVLSLTAVAIFSCNRCEEATIFQIYSLRDTLMKKNGNILYASTDDNFAELWHFFFDSVSTDDTASQTISQINITALDSTLQAAGRVWPSLVISAELAMPQPTRSHPEVAARISDTMLHILAQGCKDIGINAAGNNQPLGNSLHYMLDVCRAKMEADTIVSVVRPQYSYVDLRGTTPLMSDQVLTYELQVSQYQVGDARPFHMIQYRVFDLTDGAVLHEEDIFEMTPANKDAINNLLREAFTGLRHSDTSGTYDHKSVWDFSRMVMNGNFAVKEQSLVYHYNAVESPMCVADALDLEILSYELEPYMKKNTTLYKYWFNKKKVKL